MTTHNQNKIGGFGLIEVVVGVAIISLVLVTITQVAHVARRLARENTRTLSAAYLLEEGWEALRVMRDHSWAGNIESLQEGTKYYLDFTGTSWVATTAPAFVDGIFDRSFTVENVRRNASDDIDSSGSIDLNSRRFNIQVAWLRGAATTSREFSGYLTNLFDN